jgi:SAM-dependent methyltransferase
MPVVRYDDIADFYDSRVRDDVSDPASIALFALLGDVGGARVLDLACGQGRVSRELARRGASVVGVDLSEKLLAKAMTAESEQGLGIEFVHGDACEFRRERGSFDAIVCHFGLSDIDDLDGVLVTVTHSLRANGIFVFSILHPCFPGGGPDAPSSWPREGGYFSEGWWLADNPGFRGRVGANHRMLSTYLNKLHEQGLIGERFAEPEPDDDPTPSRDVRGIPIYFVGRYRTRRSDGDIANPS